ncbi:PITH domain-containing protein [Porphyridium purpureum]|uniref:PITH domain-containing protein n=1 Tax=Porphyridium purpureum TaxID=35688 RepID=A0A5J4Z7V3_PORPP|nr:PITH domain-containing protein [Porphyridium purpureum]|eukprot:POR1726..scf295_1
MPCSHRTHENCDHGDEDRADYDSGGDSLYAEVNAAASVVLNAQPPNDVARNVLRTKEEMMNETLPYLCSDADEQLLIGVKFMAPVKLKSICVLGRGVNSGSNPRTLKLFINKESMDFDAASSTTPLQVMELAPRQAGDALDLPTKFTKFQNVQTLWMFVSDNYGENRTEIQYIGFKGITTKHKREAVVTVYELRPQAAENDGLQEHNLPPFVG